ncbi:MAG TPA: hypothetical protein PLR90_06480 [Methylophilus sp.]|nr:hypothetical protein [Methylophilus sp.]HQQ33547.1 hypothetical protein [Methylophilus sp.]
MNKFNCSIQVSVKQTTKTMHTCPNTNQHTAEQFAHTINLLKGKVTILFITHQLPKGLQVDEAIVLGKETTTENQANKMSHDENEKHDKS